MSACIAQGDILRCLDLPICCAWGTVAVITLFAVDVLAADCRP